MLIRIGCDSSHGGFTARRRQRDLASERCGSGLALRRPPLRERIAVGPGQPSLPFKSRRSMMLDRVGALRCAGPERVDRRLKMGADNCWNSAVAIEAGERLRHEIKSGQPRIGRIAGLGIGAKSSKHVRDFPDPNFLRRDKYKAGLSSQPDSGSAVDAAQLWDSANRASPQDNRRAPSAPF